MEAYKVVRVSCDRYYSACAPAAVMVEYELNKPTIPIVGRLFVFKEKGLAKEFALATMNWGDRQMGVLVGNAKRARPRRTIIAFLSDMTPPIVWKFWRRSTKRIDIACPPMGTYSCSSFTPLGVIEI